MCTAAEGASWPAPLCASRLTSPAAQDVNKLDPATLTPLTPEVISRQATINIGARMHLPTAACSYEVLWCLDRSVLQAQSAMWLMESPQW